MSLDANDSLESPAFTKMHFRYPIYSGRFSSTLFPNNFLARIELCRFFEMVVANQ